MTWKTISDYCVMAVAVAAVVLASIAFFRKPEAKTETVSTLPINGISVNRYGVAGGGDQHVIEFTANGMSVEIIVTDH